LEGGTQLHLSKNKIEEGAAASLEKKIKFCGSYSSLIGEKNKILWELQQPHWRKK
jgi:hypothetical protein